MPHLLPPSASPFSLLWDASSPQGGQPAASSSQVLRCPVQALPPSDFNPSVTSFGVHGASPSSWTPSKEYRVQVRGQSSPPSSATAPSPQPVGSCPGPLGPVSPGLSSPGQNWERHGSPTRGPLLLPSCMTREQGGLPTTGHRPPHSTGPTCLPTSHVTWMPTGGHWVWVGFPQLWRVLWVPHIAPHHIRLWASRVLPPMWPGGW